MNILMFGFGEDWPVWERAGFRARVPNLLRAFSREEKVEKILFINNPASILRGYKNILLNRKWGTKQGDFIRLGKHSYLTRVNEKIYTLDWIGFHLFLEKEIWMDMTEGLNGRYLLRLIKKALGILDMDNILIWTANPFVQNLHRLLNERFFLFDAIDNWLEHPYLKKYSSKIRYAYTQVAKKADLITTVSSQLKDFLGSSGAKEVFWLPNAADYQYYSRINFGIYNVPEDIKSINHPILGMVGILSNDIDFELLKYIACCNKDYNIVIVGSKIEGTDISAIERLNNIYFLGYREPQTIPNYLANFDICLSVYRMNASSDSKDPIKLYEYLASGKPVVSTDIREARKLNGLIRIARSREEFAKKIEESLTADTEEDKQRRLLAAKQNTWAKRVKTILDFIELKQKNALELSIIIVNWNTKDLLKECLNSVFKKIKDISFEVIVIDNFSSDGSNQMVKTEFPQVRLIENKTNMGFGKANNQGFKISKGRHLLFLNSDTFIISDAIGDLIKFSRSYPSIGIIGPKILNSDNTAQISCQGFPRLWWIFLANLGLVRFLPQKVQTRYNSYFYNFDASCYVDCVGGACLLVKRNVFESLRGFDEDFFMYGEDLDLGYRALKLGFRSYFLNIPFIIHHQNQSGSQRWDPFMWLKENYKSFYLFYRKHYGKIALFLFRLIVCCGSLFRFGVYKLWYLVAGNNRSINKIQLNRDTFLINLKI